MEGRDPRQRPARVRRETQSPIVSSRRSGLESIGHAGAVAFHQLPWRPDQNQNYYGDSPDYPDAHLPGNLIGIVPPGAVAVAECCTRHRLYSITPLPRCRSGSPTRASFQGAIAYCGSTNTAYGESTAAARCAADILCTDFMSAVMASATTGRALLRSESWEADEADEIRSSVPRRRTAAGGVWPPRSRGQRRHRWHRRADRRGRWHCQQPQRSPSGGRPVSIRRRHSATTMRIPRSTAIGALIKWGPTYTNVGDVHVLL